MGFRQFLLSITFLFFTALSVAEDRSYDPGPDPTTPEGQGYLKVFSSIPSFRGLGEALSNDRGGKFRYSFGPIPYRGDTGKDRVTFLVIGQDGTHIAEAAGRPFTGGTGGRLENLLDHFGVENAMFINTFSYTINGQVSDFAPMIVKDKRTGNDKMVWRQFNTPEMYILGQDPSSPIVQWRNDFIEQIIRANPNSLKGIIAVGGAARDTLSTFIRSRGGEVGTMVTPESAKEIQMVKYGSVPAGGNRAFYYPVDGDGNNLLLRKGERFYERDRDGNNLLLEDGTKVSIDDKKVQEMLMKRIQDDPNLMKKAARNTAGPYDNGIYDLRQMGSDLDDVRVDGPQSMKGLVLSDGTKVNSDIRFVTVPHPGSAAAGASLDRLQEGFQKQIDKLYGALQQGWDFKPDNGKESAFTRNEKFNYKGRGDVPAHDSPFGKPRLVIVNESDAIRKGPQAIVYGSRKPGKYDDLKLQEAKQGEPAEADYLKAGEVPWEFSRLQPGVYDHGPGDKWSALLTDLDLKKVFQVKRGKTPKTDGVEAFAVGSLPQVGDFGHYRGTFDKPEVLVLADPSDLDDTYTARALTGADGQRLQGYLDGLGVGEKSLILKTVPFDMSEVSDRDWRTTLGRTKEWRQKLLDEVIKTQKPKLILTLGKWAELEMGKISTGKIPVVSLNQGYDKAFEEVKGLKGWKDRPIEYVDGPRSLPRSHLPYGMQLWVGTSGSRVLAPVKGDKKNRGGQYMVVVPNWVVKAEDVLNPAEEEFLKNVRETLREGGFSLPKGVPSRSSASKLAIDCGPVISRGGARVSTGR